MGGRAAGLVAGKADILTNAAQLGLGLGLSLAICKEKLGRQVLKQPPFGLQCIDFAQIFLKVTLLQSTKSQALSKYLIYLKEKK